MKRVLLLAVLLLPVYGAAQVSVSAVTGESGFAAVRGSLAYQYDENLTITPKYSYYKDTDESPSINKFGLRLDYQPNRIAFGVEGGFVPRKNGYLNYSAEGDIKYYLVGRTKTWYEMIYLGVAGKYLRHEQRPGYFDTGNNAIADYELDEYRPSVMAGATIKPVKIRTVFAKAYFSEDPPEVGNVWIDMPYFVTVNRSFLDYYWDTYAVFPTEYFDLHSSYSLSKEYWASNDYQSVNAGLTIKLWGVSVTGNVEIRDIDSSKRRTYYSLSSSLYFK
ncbi:hypothetical protein AAIR98_000203 [Elusimicrobium simillimum]|uniref:hypothetical protein n=1 Tax=Elusimicrobium simillimum TaxID=3143438 RepID=UPI003C7059C7